MVHATVCPDGTGKSRQSGEKSCLGRYGVVLASLVLFFAEVEAQSGAWRRKANVPFPKVGASACVVNGKIYVFGAGGCYASCHTDLAANRIYDPLTDTWESGLPLPTQRGYLSSAAVHDTIYAMGGGYPTLANLVTTVEAYDPATDSWNTKRDMLSPRFFAQAAVVDGIVYNIGGNYSQLNCEAYNPATNTWTRKKDRPEFGGALSVTAYNGVIYTFGGATYDLRPSSAVYAYDPPTDTWTKKKDMPTARFAFQTYLVNGKIYAIGGSRTGNTSIAAVEVYDPGSDTWQSKPNMPDELSCFGGAVVNDKIYVIGGTSDWVSGKSTVWEYDPAFHTEIAAGSVSGTWAFANSPYRVLGEITIPNDSTLMIEPGVEVVFMGHYKLNVQGRLLAVGTKKDTIRFTAQDIAAGWHGIRFMNTPNTNDTSRMVYCSFKYGKANTGSGLERCGGAILIHAFDKVLISDCLFDSNLQSGEGWDPPYYEAGPAIYFIYCSPVITNNTFTNNVGSKSGAITCLNSPAAVISRNTFIHNTGYSGPIVCEFGDTPTWTSPHLIDKEKSQYLPEEEDWHGHRQAPEDV